MSETYHPVEDFISTYPETQKVLEQLAEKMLPLKEYLISLKMKDGLPLVNEISFVFDGNLEFRTRVTFNDSSFVENQH